MAHELIAELHTKAIVNKDLVIEVRTVNADKSERLGKLLISKGNVEWFNGEDFVNKKRLTWKQFAAIFTEHGAPIKTKKKRELDRN